MKHENYNKNMNHEYYISNNFQMHVLHNTIINL